MVFGRLDSVSAIPSFLRNAVRSPNHLYHPFCCNNPPHSITRIHSQHNSLHF
ncbi:hypothetical protein RSAG8_00794, partial [Rhizoctonia solani AG-8 WAC10335]